MAMEDGGATSGVAADGIRPDSASAAFWDRYFAAPVAREPALSPRSARLPYIPALDGIRALAVLAVLAYHAGAGWLPGGFLGVEVFFVLSGYLITSLLLSELHSNNRVDLKSFWLRRARRLLPALFVLLIVVLSYSVIMLPDQVASLRSDAIAAAVYVMNWWLIFDHTSYFEAMGRASLLRHLWSLAVEEQFYLIWPPLFVLGMARLRSRTLFVAVVAGAMASTVLMAALYRPGVDPSRIYYGTDTRAAELFIGAALAFVWRPGEAPRWPGRTGRWIGTLLGAGRRTTILLDAAGIVALVSVGAAFWQFGEFSPKLYHGGFLLVALASAILVAVVVHPQSRLVSRMLGCAPMRWVGLRSYGIYLWHWPVYMVTRPGLDVPLQGAELMALRVGLTLGLVEISYRAVEMPFRTGRVGRLLRRWRFERDLLPRSVRVGWLGIGGALTVSTVTLGILVARAKPAEPPPYLAVQAVHIVASPPPVPASQPAARTVKPTPAMALTPIPTHVPTVTTAVDVPPPATTSVPDPTSTPETGARATAAPTRAGQPTQSATPSPTVAASYASAPTVTAIGDSVMLGAATDLANAIPNLDLDAKVGLQVSDAIQLLQERRDAGELRQVVVLDIGNNGPMTAQEFDQVMHVIGSGHRVIFLNLRVPRAWEGPNNNILASGVQRYPNASLLDWHAATANHPELFWDDGIHLRPVGSRYYAMLVAQKIALVS